MRPSWKRISLRTVGALLALLAILALADVALDEPLRRRMERTLDESLVGYSARLEELDLHLWGGSLDLHGLRILQDAHPDPPIAHFPRLTASVQWKALAFGRVVADVELDRPALYVDLRQLVQESNDEIPVDEKGWQDAVEAIYPFRINELLVHEGSLVYVDEDPDRPLRLTRVAFHANNIRNVTSRERTYPSELRLEAVVFEEGALGLEGQADFMARPHPGIEGRFLLKGIPLLYFSPVIERFGLVTRGGAISVTGGAEYGAGTRTLTLDEIEIVDADVEYGYGSPAAVDEEEGVKEAAVETAEELQDDPATLTRVDRLRIVNSRLSVTNHAAKPVYRVFLSGIDLDVENVSNQPEQGPATARLGAQLMGSGPVRGSAAFWPSESADFSLAVSVEETRMNTLNDFFRAHGNFDVVDGWLSIYASMRIKGGRVDGWVKPLFRDVDVFDPLQDAGEGFWHRTWERMVGAVSKLLRNKPRKEVATVVDISGDLDDPSASTAQIVLNLVRNAFVEAILPGLQREVDEGPDRRRRRGGQGKDDDAAPARKGADPGRTSDRQGS